MEDYGKIPYWNNNPKGILTKFNTSETGLSSIESKKRLDQFGYNELGKSKNVWFKILVSQFISPLILVLIVASVISFFLGNGTDAIIILSIVIVNGLLGFFQEFKSEKSVEKLIAFISYRTKILRDGKTIEVDSKEVVLGDLVLLGIGDKVPADVRLIKTNNFYMNESILTGEPYPVLKNENAIDKDKITVHESTNTAFMGTTVSEGEATGIVVRTAKLSEFGKTAALIKKAEPESDFQKNITRFGKMVTQVILTLVTLIFILNAILGKPWFDSFMFALALAVGIVPESLPIVITIALSNGALKLAKNEVIVKKLAAIEDLGNVNILCTDKTGTLTENKITLDRFVGIDKKAQSMLPIYSILCSSVVEGKKGIEGNHIDVAIMEYARKKDFKLDKNHKKIDDLPFDFKRRRMSVLVNFNDKNMMITKGAMDDILKICDVGQNKSKIVKTYHNFVGVGYKVIGLATKNLGKKNKIKINDENKMAFVGFIIFRDPPKKGAKNAILHAKKLGISIKILTGDDPYTTAAVAKELGLDVGPDAIITGDTIERLEEHQLLRIVDKKTIFARVTPEHKFKIIKILRQKNNVVAYLGDGVNDAPALKEADVGISVDTGADIAKDAADIVLLKKGLDVIIWGIKEGRKTFSNITKYIVNTISANFGNMGTLGFISPFLNFLPLLPSQILLNNFLTDTPMMAVSTDNVDDEEIRSPKKWNINHITKLCFYLGSISSIFDIITILALIYLVKANATFFRTGWFLESGLSEIIIVFAIRSRKLFLKGKMPSMPLILASVGTVIITLLIIYSPIGKFFEFMPLPMWFLGVIGLILVSYFVVTHLMYLAYNKYIQKEMV